MERLRIARPLEKVCNKSFEQTEQNYFGKVIDSPIGEITLIAQDEGLVAVHWGSDDIPTEWQNKTAKNIIRDTESQLKEYFSRRKKTFDLPLAPSGTSFQLEVWKELRKIPYGETISYGEQAVRLGRPSSARAVGAANGKNPIGIIVPCHRVIGANGSLTGFAGGIEMKRFLLSHERSYMCHHNR